MADFLSRVQFKNHSTPYEDKIGAHLGKQQVGWLDLDKGTGVVNEVYVKEKHQGKGIATGMWQHAQESGLNPRHSDTRSESGDAWAQSLYQKGLAPEPESME